MLAPAAHTAEGGGAGAEGEQAADERVASAVASLFAKSAPPEQPWPHSDAIAEAIDHATHLGGLDLSGYFDPGTSSSSSVAEMLAEITNHGEGETAAG